jgi:hypothetical protein
MGDGSLCLRWSGELAVLVLDLDLGDREALDLDLRLSRSSRDLVDEGPSTTTSIRSASEGVLCAILSLNDVFPLILSRSGSGAISISLSGDPPKLTASSKRFGEKDLCGGGGGIQGSSSMMSTGVGGLGGS